MKVRLTKGNIKLGNMATFSKLYGNNTFQTKYGSVSGSCGKHCEGCKSACYVRKSYRYPSVIENHAKNTVAFRTDLNGSFNQIDEQLNRKRTPFKTIRINQSGEIETAMELLKWIMLAKKHPESNFYIYTKNFQALKSAMKSDIEIPSNFTILISVWHEYGLKEFETFKDYPFIKAFVYMDGFKYDEKGLNIETTCKAYENGKMNHAITCDKCKKCFTKTFKVIGCHEH